MTKKYYIEVFDIDQKDTEILNDLVNRREFKLTDIKKKYDRTRIDRILRGLKELDLLKERGEEKNLKGQKIKIYCIDFGDRGKLKDTLFYSGKRKRFFKVSELPLF